MLLGGGSPRPLTPSSRRGTQTASQLGLWLPPAAAGQRAEALHHGGLRGVNGSPRLAEDALCVLAVLGPDLTQAGNPQSAASSPIPPELVPGGLRGPTPYLSQEARRWTAGGA